MIVGYKIFFGMMHGVGQGIVNFCVGCILFDKITIMHYC
jgi:hypothetical protein